MPPPPVDVRLAALAARQHGVVSTAQLMALGLGRGAIAFRVRRGRLHRLHRGIFAVGHPRLTKQGRWMAAVLAAGPGAVLSHRDAAALWELRRTSRTTIDVIAGRRTGHARQDGITLHTSRNLGRAEKARRHAIPVTTPVRTLLDLADVVSLQALRRAFEQADVLRLLDGAEIARLPDTHPGRGGATKLAKLAAAWETPPLTRSELERRFLTLCHDAGVAPPRCNVPLLRFEVDFLWPEHRLIVETDGHRHHGTRTAFEKDRARDAALTAAGYRVMRFTHRQVTKDPRTVARRLKAATTTRRSR